MKVLAFSDLHRDLDQAEKLVAQSREADVVIAAGDFASIHEGLGETIDALRGIEQPTVLVPGNNETEDALREACEGWDEANVLHGGSVDLEGHLFFGLGAGVPTTPWDWSFDLDEDEAASALAKCPRGAVLVLHSPPLGHCDRSGSGEELGSRAILEAVERVKPPVAVCGHIHESWGCESDAGGSRVFNLGPKGVMIDL